MKGGLRWVIMKWYGVRRWVWSEFRGKRLIRMCGRQITLFSVITCGRLVLICQEECDEKWDKDNCPKFWKQSLMSCKIHGWWHFRKPRMACCQLCFALWLLTFLSLLFQYSAIMIEINEIMLWDTPGRWWRHAASGTWGCSVAQHRCRALSCSLCCSETVVIPW